MRTLQNCCGCCTLKTGAMIIAILYVINWSFSVLSLIVQAATGDSNTENQVRERNEILLKNEYHNSPAAYGYALIPAIIELVIAVCFLYGVVKEKKYFILPQLIVQVIEIVVSIILVILGAIFIHPAILLGFIAVAISAYLWHVVYSFYHSISVVPNIVAGPYATMEMDRNNLVGKV